jgi:hypothetical protein
VTSTGDKFRKSLQKRQEALDRFKTRKESYLRYREQIIRDIEESKEIWAKTLRQMPGREFNNDPSN